MRTDFNAYLNEQKKQNLYSSKMDKVVIKEGFFDNKKYTANISFNFAGSNDVCIVPNYVIIDIVDANGNLVV